MLSGSGGACTVGGFGDSVLVHDMASMSTPLSLASFPSKPDSGGFKRILYICIIEQAQHLLISTALVCVRYGETCPRKS